MGILSPRVGCPAGGVQSGAKSDVCVVVVIGRVEKLWVTLGARLFGLNRLPKKGAVSFEVVCDVFDGFFSPGGVSR